MRKCLIYRNTHTRIPQILNSFAVLKDIHMKRSRLRDTFNLGNASLKNSDNFLHPDLWTMIPICMRSKKLHISKYAVSRCSTAFSPNVQSGTGTLLLKIEPVRFLCGRSVTRLSLFLTFWTGGTLSAQACLHIKNMVSAELMCGWLVSQACAAPVVLHVWADQRFCNNWMSRTFWFTNYLSQFRWCQIWSRSQRGVRFAFHIK